MNNAPPMNNAVDERALLARDGSALHRAPLGRATLRRAALRRAALAAVLAAAAGTAARAQDAAAGEKVFVVCRACHQIGPTAKNALGPELNGVVGRKAGTLDGYNYSAAMKDSGLTWDQATLSSYLAAPQAVVKGTKMVFPGVKDPQKVKDLIAYLASTKADGTRTDGTRTDGTRADGTRADGSKGADVAE